MKLYLVVRENLTHGMRIAQLCHAHRAFVDEHPEIEREWFSESNTLVCLEASDKELLDLVEQAECMEVPCSTFREPDLGGTLTAAAIGPSGRRLCRRLHLAGG